MDISAKNEHTHPQGEQATERQHIRSRTKKKAADDTCVRPSKIIRSEIQTVGKEALQHHDFKSTSAIFVLANGRGTGMQVIRSRVIFHFAQMSTFLPLKHLFNSAHLSSQSAQTSFAEENHYHSLVK